MYIGELEFIEVPEKEDIIHIGEFSFRVATAGKSHCFKTDTNVSFRLEFLALWNGNGNKEVLVESLRRIYFKELSQLKDRVRPGRL